MIEVKDLVKSFREKNVLDVPQLVFEERRITGIVGHNGSGKSTLLRIILDLDLPSQGTVLINNKLNTGDESWKKEIGAYLDDDFLINFLSAEEYFKLLFKLRRKDPKYYQEFLFSMEEFFDDEIIGHRKVIGDFSKGNRQKIGVAGAMIGDIKALILDEPMSHLDPGAQLALKKILRKLNTDKSLTIILSSHDSSLINDFFDNVIFFKEGKVSEIKKFGF